MFHSTSIFEFTRKMVDKGVAFLAVQQATSSKIYNWSITNCTMQTPSLWTFPHSPQWVIRLCHKSASKTSRSHENLPCVRIHWQPETHIQGTATPQTHPPTVLQGFMKKRQGSPSFRVSQVCEKYHSQFAITHWAVHILLRHSLTILGMQWIFFTIFISNSLFSEDWSWVLQKKTKSLCTMAPSKLQWCSANSSIQKHGQQRNGFVPFDWLGWGSLLFPSLPFPLPGALLFLLLLFPILALFPPLVFLLRLLCDCRWGFPWVCGFLILYILLCLVWCRWVQVLGSVLALAAFLSFSFFVFMALVVLSVDSLVALSVGFLQVNYRELLGSCKNDGFEVFFLGNVCSGAVAVEGYSVALIECLWTWRHRRRHPGGPLNGCPSGMRERRMAILLTKRFRT